MEKLIESYKKCNRLAGLKRYEEEKSFYTEDEKRAVLKILCNKTTRYLESKGQIKTFEELVKNLEDEEE